MYEKCIKTMVLNLYNYFLTKKLYYFNNFSSNTVIFVKTVIIIFCLFAFLYNLKRIFYVIDEIHSNSNNDDFGRSEINYVDELLNLLVDFKSTVNCNLLFHKNHKAIDTAIDWEYNENESLWLSIESATDKCSYMQKLLVLPQKPLSIEEKNFPIAFAIETNSSSLTQTLFLLSSLYQPQNHYCLIVGNSSSDLFQSILSTFGECFPNTFILNSPNNQFCSFNIVRSIFGCLRYFNALANEWKQFLYVPSVDFPLKTNLEMVRIFKETSDAFITDLEPFNFEPKPINKTLNFKPPLPIWKSTVTATFNREAAKVLCENSLVQDYFRYLENVHCSEHYLWATLAGNPDYIEMPGGYDAKTFWKQIEKSWLNLYNLGKTNDKVPSENNPFPLQNYYIASYYVWNSTSIDAESRPKYKIPDKCGGSIDNQEERCIFGVKDLPRLIVRPELLAHKFYMDVQPAAYFCIYERIKKRSYDFKNQRDFVATEYQKLPQIEMLHGNEIKNLKFFFK